MFVKRYLAHHQGDYKAGQFDIVGNPVLTDEGVVNGFSTSNYLLTPQVIDLSTANTWEIGMKLTTGSTVSGAYDFFGCAQSEGNALGMLINNGKWLFSIGRNGSWISSADGTNAVSANTTYWVKMQFTGTNYIFSFSTDGETWIEDKKVSSTTKITAGTYGYIGRSSPWLNRSFNGSIDLKGCYIKINGSLWWGNAYTEDIYATKYYAITTKQLKYYSIVNPKNKKDVSDVLYSCYYNSTAGIYCYAKLPIAIGDKLYGKSGGWTSPVSNSSELVWDNISTIASIGYEFIVDTLNIKYQRNYTFDLSE